MAKQRKRGKTSRQSLPVSFSTDIVRWQDGDTTKPDPFFILIINNIALERPLGSNNFVADMSTGSKAEKANFTQTAQYVKENLFGELPGQAEKLLAELTPQSKNQSMVDVSFWLGTKQFYIVGGRTPASSSNPIPCAEAGCGCRNARSDWNECRCRFSRESVFNSYLCALLRHER